VKKLVLTVALLAAIPNAFAEDRFVTDQFKITLRSGQSPTHKIIRMLPSGYQLKVISSNKSSGYSEVQTKDGKRGFVLSRQLDALPSARVRIVEIEKRLDELQSEPERLAAKLSTLQDAHKKLTSEQKVLSKAKQGIEAELKSIQRTAGSALRISAERNELRKQVGQLIRQVENLKQENRELSNESSQQWFLIGAGVLVSGIILGLIIPSLRVRRRKSSWGSL